MAGLLSLPLYQQLAVAAAAGSFLLCLFTLLYGRLFRRLSRPLAGLPELPLFPGGSFPSFWDKAYTLLFTAGYTVMAVESVTHAGGYTYIGTGLVLSTLLMYTPMILRLAFLPAPVVPLGTPAKALVAIPLALVVFFAVTGLTEALHFSDWIRHVTQCPAEQNVVELFRQGDSRSKLLVAISACLVAPVGEECFFRGFLYNILKKNTGCVAAALCTSFYFGAIHGALLQLLPLSIFGLIQCYLYERFRTLWVPMAFHAVFNSFSLAMIFFDVLPS